MSHTESPDFERAAEARQILAEAKIDRDEIARLRAALVQIVHVCDDNASKNCNKAMALVFVREVAATAIRP